MQNVSSQIKRIGATALAVAGAAGLTTAVAEAAMSHSHRTVKQQPATTIGVKQSGALGQVLDAGTKHLTVYMYTADHGNKSSCSGACAKAWPPVTTVAKPKVAGGARAGLIGTIRRSGNVKQVTYKGHPLYYFAADKAAKTSNGQGLDGAWYVLSASGQVVKKSVAPATSGSTTATTSTPTTSSTPTTGTPTTSMPTTTATTPATTTTSSPTDGWS
jgi:predicted lipoprotein with Yx(FWY)xxD motif